MGEPPILLKPAIEGFKRSQHRWDVILQRLLHANTEGGKHHAGLDALIIQLS